MKTTIGLMVVFLGLGLAVSFAPTAEPKVEEAKDLVQRKQNIQRILSAKNPQDLREQVHKLMAPATRRQLRKYKRHSHLTISLHAVWEEVKRITHPVRIPIHRSCPFCETRAA